MRVRILLALVAAALAAAPLAAADVDADRARAAEAALNRAYAIHGSGLYRETIPHGRVALAWPFSQALAAGIAVAALPDATAAERTAAAVRVAQLDHRYGSRLGYRSRPGGDLYVDDNEWLALDLLDWHAQHGDAAALARAVGVFRAVVAAWDADPADPCPGGGYWTPGPANRDRNAVTTAAGALLAARLYELERKPLFQRWSRRMLDWLDGCLRAPSGLYFDHVGGDGSIDRTTWSYNQGAVIGAETLTYQLAGDPNALARAEELADASLGYLDPSTLGREPPEFVAILCRNLLELGSVDGEPRWREAVQAYADAAWATTRDPSTGLFRFGRARPRLLDQAAVTQIYALLAKPVTAGP